MAHPRAIRESRPLAGLLALLSGTALAAAAPTPPAIVAPLADEALDRPIRWPAPTNAAPIYWRGFMLHATNESLKGVDWTLLTADDDEAGYRLTSAEIEQLSEVQSIIATALRARSVPSANWEIDYELGVNALLPHLGPMRNMARLLAADIRRCVTENDIDGAIDRFEALHAMSRHVRGDGILISSLVSAAITNLATTQTSHFLAQVELTTAQRDRLVAAVDAYGKDDPFAVRQAITNEGVWLTAWLAEKVREGSFTQEMDMLFSLGDGSDAGAIERIKRLSDDAMLEELRSCRRYYADAVSVWSETDAVDRLEALEALVQEGHYGRIAQVLAAALSKSHAADQRGHAALEASRSEILADPLAPTGSN